MSASARFMVLVLALVAISAVVLAPRGDEWLAMLADDKKNAEVISLLEQKLANGERDPRLLASLSRAYAATGQADRAIEVITDYIKSKPEDVEAYGRLADLYKMTADVPRRIDALERLLAKTTNPARGIELADLYVFTGRFADGRAMLSRYVNHLSIENGLLFQLASSYANAGEHDSAVRVLMRAEVTESGKSKLGNERERILLAGQLAAGGRGREAVKLAKRWIKEQRQAWLADRLLRSIAGYAEAADAVELADAVMVLHPEIRFYLAHGLTDSGNKAIARHLLETWIDAYPAPTMEELAGFLSASRYLGDPGIVWATFGKVIAKPDTDDVILRYCDGIAAEFGIGALAPFWQHLPRSAMDRRPTLSARLAFHEGDAKMVRALLDRVDVAALDPVNRRYWSDLLSAVSTAPEAFTKLHAMQGNARLPSDLLVKYAQLAGSLGREKDYRRALQRLNGKSQ